MAGGEKTRKREKERRSSSREKEKRVRCIVKKTGCHEDFERRGLKK